MKLDARRIDAYLKDPGPSRAVLLHGEDVGLIREYGARLTRAVAGGTDDPFRVVELGAEAAGQLADELAQPPLTGGRRVVRVRDVPDSAAAAVARALAGTGPGFLVLEAPGLKAGKLRTLMEKSTETAVIACYPATGRALAQTIAATLQSMGVQAERDALDWLTDHLGADAAVTQREVEKLGLYAGTGGRVDMEAARLATGDLAGLSLEDALFAATAGDVPATDRALELAMAEGAAPVAVLRALLLHLHKLQRARAAMDDGRSAGEAAKSLRPPIFFKREPIFTQALALWSTSALEAACKRAWDAELGCKRTGAPDDAIARSAVLGVAQRAAVLRRR